MGYEGRVLKSNQEFVRYENRRETKHVRHVDGSRRNGVEECCEIVEDFWVYLKVGKTL